MYEVMLRGYVRTMMVYTLFRVIVYTFIKQAGHLESWDYFWDHPRKRCVCHIAGNYGGLALPLVFERKVAFVGADPLYCP